MQRKTLKIVLVSTITLVIIMTLVLLVSLLPTFTKQNDIDTPTSYTFQPEYYTAEEVPSEFKMLFLGDIMLARSVGENILNGIDPFVNMKEVFSDYDLIIGNLETVVSEEQYAIQNPNKLFTFNSPVESINILRNNRIEIVSLANNHTMDFGYDALLNTMDNLKTGGILAFGAGRNISEAFEPKYVYFQKTKIALLGFNDIENWVTDATEGNPGSANFEISRIVESIKVANENSDLAIILPHWGIEYSLTNSSRQEEYAKLFIENGADIVIGSHPHVLQNEAEYNNKKIYYSLGNFVFDDMCTIANACSAGMVEVVIDQKEIVSSQLIKVKLSDSGFPELE